MISIDELYIVNYCHPNCVPLKNIMRLPENEAFLLAEKMAAENPDTTAFYRFADFANYYRLRLLQDEYLYNKFISLGGKPQERHPLSFVLRGSGYLENWFGNGIVTRLGLERIPSEFISFTLGDSGAVYEQYGEVTMYTKEQLLEKLTAYEGSVDDFIKKEVKAYIEVQLWDDTVLIMRDD